MQTFLSGDAVTLTFDLLQTGIAPSAVTYRVVDQDGAEVVSEIAVPGYAEGDNVVTVEVAGIANTLPTGVKAMARAVEVFVAGTGGMTSRAVVRTTYRVVRSDRLVVPENSFQGLMNADMLALDLLDVEPFTGADENQKVAALVEAHRRLARYRYRWVPFDWQSRVNRTLSVAYLDEYTLADWNSLDNEFRSTMQVAQVMLAADLLRDDPDTKNREADVVSVTIGDSSRTYRQVGRAKHALTERVRRQLSKYLVTGIRIGRA